MPSLKIKLRTVAALPPVPRPPREPKYPFAQMGLEENNSFFVPGVKANTMHSAITRFLATEEGKDKKFSVRATEEVVEGEESKGPQPGILVLRTK